MSFRIRFVSVAAIFAVALASLFAFSNVSPTQAADQCDTKNAVWVGTYAQGLNCLDDAGWHSFTPESGISGSGGLAACDDGIYVGSGLNVKKFNGGTSTDLPKGKWIGIESISCAGKGTIWTSTIQGVSYFDGTKWTDYEKQFGTGPFTSILKKVVAGQNGTAWALTNGSISLFDGSKWTAFEKGKGLDKDYNFNDVVVDSKGGAWALTSDGLLKYNDGKWVEIKDKSISGATALAVDADGKLWVGTTKGLSFYDGKKWTSYDRKGSKLSSNSIRSLAVDGQGRVWIGTDYGLNIFDGKTWTLYLMSNSDILDNTVATLSVIGNGAKLPATTDKKPGSITGVIMSGKSPVAGATFELCTEFVGVLFTGKTPCGDNPYTQSVKTDDKGVYTLENVPVGRYGFVIQGKDGKWIQFIGLDSKIEVTEGKETELPTLDISKVK